MSVQWSEGSHRAGHTNRFGPSLPSFQLFLWATEELETPRNKNKENCFTRARSPDYPLSLSFRQDTARPEARLSPKREDSWRTEVTAGRSRDAAGIGQLLGSAQGHSLAAPARSPAPGAPPGVLGWLPLALREWPAEPDSGAEAGGWAEDEEAAPRGVAGGGALPDSWGRRPARYSRPAWRSRARSRPPGAPGRPSAARALWSGLSGSPERRPPPERQRSTLNRRRLHSHRPARRCRSQSARGLCGQSGRGAPEDAVRRYPGLPGGGGREQPEEPRLPWKPPRSLQGPLGLQGPSNCFARNWEQRFSLQLHLILENWESVGFMYSITWIMIFEILGRRPLGLQKEVIEDERKGPSKNTVNLWASGQIKEH